MKMAIRFHDNDFGQTFRAVAEAMYESFKWAGQFPTDKEKLAYIINNMSLAMYVLRQNQWEHKYERDEDFTAHFEHTRKYIHVEPTQILVDKEVDKFLEENQWDNSETVIMDTAIFCNNVYLI